jgi:hypothetical protein
MKYFFLPALLAAGLGLSLIACCTTASTDSSEMAAMPGKVTNLPAFADFITTKPTPAQFRNRYPDVALVLPGQVATKEMRLDNSRYFAELDAEGRITGGRFM